VTRFILLPAIGAHALSSGRSMSPYRKFLGRPRPSQAYCKAARPEERRSARGASVYPRAVEIIKALPRQLDAASSLFPLSQDEVIRAFRHACIAAGVTNLKFHDLRHEGVSRICERLPMHEAMRVSGHKTPAMLMGYYHPKGRGPGAQASVTAPSWSQWHRLARRWAARSPHHCPGHRSSS